MVGSGDKFYKWIIANGFPDGFRIMCLNCNITTGMLGHCPHSDSDANLSHLH